MTARRSYHSRAFVVIGGLIALGGAIVPAPARAAESLHELLAAVAAEARTPHPLRADVRIERDGKPVGDAILLAHGKRLYLETRSGTRALLSPGKVVVRRGKRVVRAAPDAALDGTSLLLADLEPFATGSLATPQVSDETPSRIVVTAAPAPPSPYTLLVHTIDRDQDVIVQTKYYRDTISNLEKIRRDEDVTQVGDRWRPGHVSVETFREPGTTRLTLAWREDPDAPAALFTPAGLRDPSPLRFQ